MSHLQWQKRLDRLEAQRGQPRSYQLRVVYYGEPEPEVDDSWSLVVVLHRPWCTTTGYPGACQPHTEEEAADASL